MIKAEIVAHSKTPQGHEFISYVLDYPLIIHAEVMTHRMFSRNAASARAIPYVKYRDSVEQNLFVPLAWQKAHSGMQGTEYLPQETQNLCNQVWKAAFENAKAGANLLVQDYKATKQLANRLLHPFAYMRLLVTTGVNEGLKNFFELRNHKDAEIHIQALAKEMEQKYVLSQPEPLKEGGWHVPFKREVGKGLMTLLTPEELAAVMETSSLSDELGHKFVKIATGMAARTSYTLFPEEKDADVYIRIHDKMIESVPFHASPFEHCIRAMNKTEYQAFSKTRMVADFPDDEPYAVLENGWCDNYRGGISYRYIIANNLPFTNAD